MKNLSIFVLLILAGSPLFAQYTEPTGGCVYDGRINGIWLNDSGTHGLPSGSGNNLMNGQSYFVEVELFDHITTCTGTASLKIATAVLGELAGVSSGKLMIPIQNLNIPPGVHLMALQFDRLFGDQTLATMAVTISASTGLEQINARNAISIYPNPATSNLTVSAPYLINSVSISNLIGQTTHYTPLNSSDKMQLDVADLPAGIYFVGINGIYVKKFVKE